ncbi:MAG: hypothetical protein IPJ49_30980 [Candidatus Obscuribacter sp.]|nr:hypothetical protein [Candidatus Obscuribacter sp.]
MKRLSSRASAPMICFDDDIVLGHKVDRIEINELASDTYFATIFIKSMMAKRVRAASRPSTPAHPMLLLWL